MSGKDIGQLSDLFHEAAHRFADYGPQSVDYQEIAEYFRRLSGARFVSFNEISGDMEYSTTMSIAGLKESIKKASNLFGFPLVGSSYRIDPQLQRIFETKSIVEYEDLCQLVASQIPPEICSRVLGLFNLGKTYALALFARSTPIADKLPELIYHLDAEGRIEFINQAIQRYGYTREELKGAHILDLIHPQDRDKARWKLAERRTGARCTRDFEVRLLTRDRKAVYLSITNHRVTGDPILLVNAEGLYSGEPGAGEFLGTLGIGRDITERKALQNELDQQSQMTRMIIEHLGEAAWLEEIEPARSLYLNPAGERLFQVSSEEMRENPRSWLKVLHPEDRRNMNETLDRQPQEKPPSPVEYRVLSKEGEERRIRSRMFPVKNLSGETTRYVGLAQDITKEWQEKKQLQESLAREQAFVRELNHRVKNNLSMIDSMLNLEVSRLSPNQSPQEGIALLEKIRNRIRAVGVVHEMLYGSSRAKEVELARYLRELGTGILSSAAQPSGNIRLDFETPETLWLPIAVSIPLGMIYSELITNALKYAFPERSGGTIRVVLEERESDQYLLQVCDDGSALSPDYDRKNQSIGHSLISALARQIDGEFRIRSEADHECFILTFSGQI
ncbi:MAG TPA: PAS domain S-box protein [Sediminispirochaeta sp.]|nr:PAS domain S-box protein [Sediminispirochaeta sp.]